MENRYFIASLAIFIVGIILIFIGFLLGESKAGLIFIFPVIYGNGSHAFFGIICIMISFILSAIGFFKKFEGEYEGYKHEPMFEPIKKERKIEGGGIVLIGPIPIIFASNWKIAGLLIGLAIALMIMFYLLVLVILKILL